MIIYFDCMTRQIDRSAGTVWRQVAADLRDRILGGEITSRLPSETDLAWEYQTAITTIRKALKQLREQGLIETEHGWGSRVVHGDPPSGGESP